MGTNIKFAVFVTALIMSGAKAGAQPETRIGTTFAVDNVAVASDRLGTVSGREVSMHWTGDAAYLQSSLDGYDGELVYIDESPFFAMVCYAFAQHRPIVLSPDEVWMVICQGFSQFVNRDPETFRHYLVRHDGKERLTVEMGPSTPWEQMIDGFAHLIDKSTGNGITDVLTADFSTTGTAELVASKIVLMDAVKKYYEYVGMRLICGIPSVTLKGTVQDWEKVRAKTRSLGNFGVKPWTDRLDPILEQFVNASAGNADLRFWQDMALKDRPEEFILRGSCGPRASLFNGWFLEFFPFDNNGIRPAQVPYQTMPSEMCQTPFTLNDVDGSGNIVRSTPMKLMAGIAALSQDSATAALEPVIGWIVLEDTDNSSQVQSTGSAGGRPGEITVTFDYGRSNDRRNAVKNSGPEMSGKGTMEYWCRRALVSIETAVEGFAPIQMKDSPTVVRDSYTVTGLPEFYSNHGETYTRTIIHEFDAKGNETQRTGYVNGIMDKAAWTVTYTYVSGKWTASYTSDQGHVRSMSVSERNMNTAPAPGVMVLDDEGRCVRITPDSTYALALDDSRQQVSGLAMSYLLNMDTESFDMTPTGYQYIVTKSHSGRYEAFRSIIKQKGMPEHATEIHSGNDSHGNWTKAELRKTDSSGNLSTFAVISREISYRKEGQGM